MRQKCCIYNCNNNMANRKTCLCHMHDLRFKRFGTTNKSKNNVDKTKPCSVNNCNNQMVTNKGYCLLHYKRFIKYGTVNLPERVVKYCAHCTKKAESLGLCSRHYQALKLHKDALYVDKKRAAPNGQGYLKGTGRYSVLHREIAEACLGRQLRKKEIVHHIDLNKLNNHPSNLYVCKNSSEHATIHAQLNRLKKRSIELNEIKFKNGQYTID